MSAFLAVAARISAAGGNPELMIGPADRDLLTAARSTVLPIHVLDEIDQLLLLLKTADGFIGNDSGVAHLAACLGLPTAVIFTVSDPKRWRPNGPAVATLAPRLPCQPCFETHETNCPQPECLKAVGPDTVWRTFSRLCEARGSDDFN
jgi:ADP-heptose:LPS heptosyltransferase